MKKTTIAIIAAILPVQMAFAGGHSAKNAMDVLESLNDKGYVDLGIEETNKKIIVYGEKKGKRVALTYEKDGFDLVGKRVTKVNPRNVSSDKKGVARLHDAEETTIDAREELNDLREIGAPAGRVHEAEETFYDAEEEEDDIRAILSKKAGKKDGPGKKKKGKRADGPGKKAEVEEIVEVVEKVGKKDGPGKKKKGKRADGPGKKRSGIVERLHEAEETTIDAREELNDLRELRAPAGRVHEAEETLYDAEEEEEDIRAIAQKKH